MTLAILGILKDLFIHGVEKRTCKDLMANLTRDGNQTTHEEFCCYKEALDGIHKKPFILTLNILMLVTAFLGNALTIAGLLKA